ncbi:hypothetical protein QM565_22580 [Geitlerinema splendidum]|nr:hypothetical protein [Geitlerinema splendidum]
MPAASPADRDGVAPKYPLHQTQQETPIRLHYRRRRPELPQTSRRFPRRRLLRPPAVQPRQSSPGDHPARLPHYYFRRR